jgi:hypothetical protein
MRLAELRIGSTRDENRCEKGGEFRLVFAGRPKKLADCRARQMSSIDSSMSVANRLNVHLVVQMFIGGPVSIPHAPRILLLKC